MLRSLGRRAGQILVRDGPYALVEQLYNKIYKTRLDPKFWYWHVRGQRNIRINGERISVEIADVGVYNEIEFLEANEREVIADIVSELSADDVFVDVGANVGVHTIFAGRTGADLYSIEPHAENLAHLLSNVRANNTSVTIYQCALADSAGYVEVLGPRTDGRADGSVTISELRTADGQGARCQIRSERGDDLFNSGIDLTPTALKIDVEGAEDAVLEGLAETLKSEHCRLVYCEVHEDQVDRGDIVSLLESYGFAVATLDERRRGKVLKAIQESS